MKYLVTNISWDTTDDEGNPMQGINLPDEIVVEADDEADAVNKASDEAGFCINDCNVVIFDEWKRVFHEEVLPQLRGAREILIVGPTVKAESIIYELLTSHPQVNVRKNPECGLSLREQQHALASLRNQIPYGETLVVATNSPVIVSSASPEARIIVVDYGPRDVTELNPHVYVRKQLDSHMFNTLMTSEIFGLESARVTPGSEDYTTADSYTLHRINRIVEQRLHQQHAAGKKFLSDEQIDEIINGVLDEDYDKPEPLSYRWDEEKRQFNVAGRPEITVEIRSNPVGWYFLAGGTRNSNTCVVTNKNINVAVEEVITRLNEYHDSNDKESEG